MYAIAVSSITSKALKNEDDIIITTIRKCDIAKFWNQD